MNKKEIDVIAWLRWVPIYIIGTMGNFVEYIISGYLNGGYTDGTAAAGFFIIGVAYAFLAVLAWAEYAGSLPKNKN